MTKRSTGFDPDIPEGLQVRESGAGSTVYTGRRKDILNAGILPAELLPKKIQDFDVVYGGRRISGSKCGWGKWTQWELHVYHECRAEIVSMATRKTPQELSYEVFMERMCELVEQLSNATRSSRPAQGGKAATFEVGAYALYDGITVKITREYGLHKVTDDAGEFVDDGKRFNLEPGYFVEEEGGEEGFVPAHKLRLPDGKMSHLKLVTEFSQQGD